MATNNTKKEVYQVEGMTCSGCERTVQKVVGNIEGVSSTKADHTSSTLVIEYDPGKVNEDSVKAAVERVGYKFKGARH
jgi:mercuric ion transport protein